MAHRTMPKQTADLSVECNCYCYCGCNERTINTRISLFSCTAPQANRSIVYFGLVFTFYRYLDVLCALNDAFSGPLLLCLCCCFIKSQNGWIVNIVQQKQQQRQCHFVRIEIAFQIEIQKHTPTLNVSATLRQIQITHIALRLGHTKPKRIGHGQIIV